MTEKCPQCGLAASHSHHPGSVHGDVKITGKYCATCKALRYVSAFEPQVCAMCRTPFAPVIIASDDCQRRLVEFNVRLGRLLREMQLEIITDMHGHGIEIRDTRRPHNADWPGVAHFTGADRLGCYIRVRPNGVKPGFELLDVSDSAPEAYAEIAAAKAEGRDW